MVSLIILNYVLAAILSTLAGFFLALLATLLKEKRKERREMEHLVEHFRTEPKSVGEILHEAGLGEKDRKTVFVILTVRAERKMREFASSIADFRKPLPIHKIAELLIKRDILDEKWRNSFDRLWHTRNRVVHSMNVSDAEIKIGSELAASLIINLEKLEEKHKSELPKSTFEVYRDAAGKFRWRFKAPNGEILAVSEAYESKAGCKNGIEALKKNFSNAIMKDLAE